MVLKALSIKQPWAWLILHAGKDIENRSWNTEHRGQLLIHASKTIDKEAFHRFLAEFPSLPQISTMQTGGIVGVVNMVDVLETCPSEWFEGPFGFWLQDPMVLPFKPYRGQQGIFNVRMDSPEMYLANAVPSWEDR